MSRKDFELIARVIASAMPDPAAADIAHEFARELATTNPRFNAGRFLAACDVPGYRTGTHRHVGTGYCRTCGHHGDDCTGTVS